MHRRGILRSIGGAALCFTAKPALTSAPPRSLALLNLHTGERLRATYFEDGDYLADAMAALNHVLRDHRTGEVHAMAPRLFDLLNDLGRTLQITAVFEVISGYRSPRTNAALQARGGGGVATRSLHMDGLAMDVRLPGIELSRLRDAALSLRQGGVGYYPDPANNFVHVDVGRIRRW